MLTIRQARARGESGVALDEQIDAFALAGTPDHARGRLRAWVEAGLDAPIAVPVGRPALSSSSPSPAPNSSRGSGTSHEVRPLVTIGHDVLLRLIEIRAESP